MASPSNPSDAAAAHAALVASRDPFQRTNTVPPAQSGDNARFLAPRLPAYRAARVIAIGDVL